MQENKKKCNIIGFGQYKDKNTNEEMLRIVIGIKSDNEKYYGTMIAQAFLNYENKLEEDLKAYINEPNKYEAYYESTDNIVTGKTQVNKIIIGTK